MTALPSIPPERPLIICDADEVLLQFMGGLERFLNRRGLTISLDSYALTGNIRREGIALEQPEVSGLLKEFYAADGLDLDPAPGASEVLDRLSRAATIVVLSNVSPEAAIGRAANLARHGMAYPVISNSGAKGAAVKRLAEAAAAPVFFLDDIGWHLETVAEAWPETHQIHFINDPRLFRLAQPSPHARLFTSSWAEAGAHLRTALDAL